MKGVILRGLGRSSLLLYNLIYTSTVYSKLPPAAFCFLRDSYYQKFVANGKSITVRTGIARKSLSNEYVPANIDCSYNAYVSRELSQSFEAAVYQQIDPDTIGLSLSNYLNYSKDVKFILKSHLASILKKKQNPMARQLMEFKNVVLFNPDLYILSIVNKYYKEIYSKHMKNDTVQPLNIVAITETSSSRNIQRIDPFLLKFHDSANDVILFDIADLNPYQHKNKENKLTNFFKNLNNDARKLVHVRTTDISTFTFKKLMETFSEGYIKGLSILFQSDPLVLKDVATDDGYLELYQKYIPEFQWFVKTNFPDLLDKFGGDIEKSPFSQNSLNHFITDMTKRKRTSFELFADNNYTNRLAATRMDPARKVRYIEEAVTFASENSIAAKLGLHQFFQESRLEDNKSKEFMPNTHLLFQMCVMKVKINTYEKEKTRLNFKDDVEFIKSLFPKK